MEYYLALGDYFFGIYPYSISQAYFMGRVPSFNHTCDVIKGEYGDLVNIVLEHFSYEVLFYFGIDDLFRFPIGTYYCISDENLAKELMKIPPAYPKEGDNDDRKIV